MVKTEFGLLEVQRKGLRWDAFELGQTEFGIGPEGLDSIDMAVTSGEFIFSMMDSKVLGVSDIHQALIASPTVTVDDAIDRDMAPNNLLQRGFSGIRDNLRIDPAIAFVRLKIPKTMVFDPAPRPRLPRTRRGPK
jgi:hypothetical protein